MFSRNPEDQIKIFEAKSRRYFCLMRSIKAKYLALKKQDV
jgi:hypothetical protein